MVNCFSEPRRRTGPERAPVFPEKDHGVSGKRPRCFWKKTAVFFEEDHGASRERPRCLVAKIGISFKKANVLPSNLPASPKKNPAQIFHKSARAFSTMSILLKTRKTGLDTGTGEEGGGLSIPGAKLRIFCRKKTFLPEKITRGRFWEIPPASHPDSPRKNVSLRPKHQTPPLCNTPTRSPA